MIGHALGPMGRELEGVFEDPLLDLWGHAVGMGAARPTFLLDECFDPADLEGAFDLVEGIAVVSHDLAGLRDVSEFCGEFEQRELASCTVCQGGHLVSPR